MLCVNSYPADYIDRCEATIRQQVEAFDSVAATTAIAAEPLRELERHFFNNMVLCLEGYFVHRARAAEGKDGNALNEVRMLSASLMVNDGELRAEKSIKYDPARSVLGLAIGDRIALDEAAFAKLSVAFFAEIRGKFSG